MLWNHHCSCGINDDLRVYSNEWSFSVIPQTRYSWIQVPTIQQHFDYPLSLALTNRLIGLYQFLFITLPRTCAFISFCVTSFVMSWTWMPFERISYTTYILALHSKGNLQSSNFQKFITKSWYEASWCVQ